MTSISYYFFAVRWLWKHRNWHSSRQKYKALDRTWEAWKARKQHA